jgi:hypothetical protein
MAYPKTDLAECADIGTRQFGYRAPSRKPIADHQLIDRSRRARLRKKPEQNTFFCPPQEAIE